MGSAEFEQVLDDLLRSARELSATELPASPMAVVRDAIAVHGHAERLVAASIDLARGTGCTWQEIGDALGMSRQGAFQKYGRPIDPRTGNPMDTTPLAGSETRALAVFSLIAAGQWEAARSDFDATMSEKLSAEALADTWAQIIGQVGSYEHAGAPTTRRRGDYTVVDVPLAFEAGDMTGRVSYGLDGQISGLFVLTPEYANQG